MDGSSYRWGTEGLLVRISKPFGSVNRPEAWKQQEERCPDFEKGIGKFKLCKYGCMETRAETTVANGHAVCRVE
jgi:hypothetical protein